MTELGTNDNKSILLQGYAPAKPSVHSVVAWMDTSDAAAIESAWFISPNRPQKHRFIMALLLALGFAQLYFSYSLTSLVSSGASVGAFDGAWVIQFGLVAFGPQEMP